MENFMIGFLTLALAHFMALLSPGVDFFIILSNSSKYGKVGGVLTSTGIAFANLFYILLALFGITLIKENQLIFTLIKILGSIYLLYIGFLLLKSKKRELFGEKIEKKKTKKDIFKYFSMGFFSAILNPKNSIFYFTMFSISIQNDTSFSIQIFYAAWMFFAVLLWDIFIVYLVTNKKSKIFLEKFSNHIEKISGFILIIIAILINI
ncbi:lysine transporter LysE [Halarcobacter ebronensis]|uniref:Lysine transporter LysE n=1 Tax=Halarcobacter ebronensis TaxID=1462615 RepID=A0A4Q0YDD5_9BACT|nr:LysE family translocator [Halarcobacter ebronensis]RXJ68466.1 lysine transporter LysE [Halarcobacter ebronensis]